MVISRFLKFYKFLSLCWAIWQVLFQKLFKKPTCQRGFRPIASGVHSSRMYLGWDDDDEAVNDIIKCVFSQIEKSITKIRSQVIRHSHDTPVSMLEHEKLYFQERMKEFELIATTLRQLKAELEDVQREQALYHSMM